jgi:hypothetical protein
MEQFGWPILGFIGIALLIFGIIAQAQRKADRYRSSECSHSKHHFCIDVVCRCRCHRASETRPPQRWRRHPSLPDPLVGAGRKERG